MNKYLRYLGYFITLLVIVIGAILVYVKFELPSIAHTFKKGHRIMVQVQSSWFPLADRNPQQFIDIYHCSPADFIKSDIKIYHSTTQFSKIILPILQ